MAPDATVPAALVVPLACAVWSTTDASGAADRPEYSETAAPTSALAVGVTLIVGRVPPPAVIGALHTLISVLSEALKCSSSTYVLPAESVTLLAVAAPLLQTPTSTTRRLPAVTFELGVSVSLVRFSPCAVTCWTNAGAELAAPADTTRAQQPITAATAKAAATRTTEKIPVLSPIRKITLGAIGNFCERFGADADALISRA